VNESNYNDLLELDCASCGAECAPSELNDRGVCPTCVSKGFDKPCTDCGDLGHSAGAMECPFPADHEPAGIGW
jgi:hypothetical protein